MEDEVAEQAAALESLGLHMSDLTHHCAIFSGQYPELTCILTVQKSKARFMACVMKSLCWTEMSAGEVTHCYIIYHKTFEILLS